MWVPPEIKDPILQHAPTRKSVACFGAVSLRTGQFVRMMCEVFNAETFHSFLRMLRHQRRRAHRMVLVLDNARYHHAVLLAPFLRRHARSLRLLFLPPYSPQLAPIETSLETDPAARHAQPLLRHAPGSAPGCRCLLRSLVSSESGATTTMLLHYLRRCV